MHFKGAPCISTAGGIPLVPSIPKRNADKPISGWTRAMEFSLGFSGTWKLDQTDDMAFRVGPGWAGIAPLNGRQVLICLGHQPQSIPTSK